MSRRTGSRARLKAAKRSAKNPDVKKKKPAERPSFGATQPDAGTRPAR